ncbi:hypothetical protein [Calothrix sp. PCC 7507]|uniref:hypothetical protein n=1 Tax=Calothrix sp. PCC 7507 TaxID=99598 RepID=UPI00029F07AE|nr:hypothetical protein [Calothrix sp. PCC 7507]AFY36206.1 hypothetical protein Cal7507_5893 [Calothrix sp. PCC 7507]
MDLGVGLRCTSPNLQNLQNLLQLLPHSSSVDTILKAIAQILKMCCNSQKLNPEAIALFSYQLSVMKLCHPGYL